MSRTRKDRPYWVRLNQDGTQTDHDHRRLGQVHYKRKYLKDAKGEDVYREVDVIGTVDGYLNQTRWSEEGIYYTSWRDETRPATNIPIMTFKAAKELHSAGRGNERIVMARKSERAYVTVYSHTTADHCTAGVKLNKAEWKTWRYGEIPCMPELSRADEVRSWSGRTPGFKKTWSREWYGHERVVTNGLLSRTAKEWNSGNDVDDWDENTYVTGQHRHGASWWL